MARSRRGFLAAGTVALSAGCLDAPEFSDGFERIHTSLFPLADWTRILVPEEVTVENAVEVGRSGHGWEPPGDLAAEVARSNAFVYLDHPAFSWAQDIAEQLRRDYPDVAVIDAFPDIPAPDGQIVDPHVWVDPVHVQSMVATLADRLAELAGDAETVPEHAATYRSRVSAIDEALQETVQTAAITDAVFAGHDSFGYLEDRYRFTLHTPVGVSPDAVPAANEVAGLIDRIDEHGIRTILYDPFTATAGEHPQLVDVLLENSDATDAAALTSLEATTAEWRARDWGWVEQMQEINIPALEQALEVG